MKLPLALAIMTIMGVPSLGFIPDSFAQTNVTVTTPTPCFLNYTAGVEMWENCGFQDDYISATLVGFEWVSGGNFTLMIVTVLIIMTYLKYQTIVYPIAIGIVMLPFSYFVFPDEFLSFAIVTAGIGIAGIIWVIYIVRTKEY